MLSFYSNIEIGKKEHYDTRHIASYCRAVLLAGSSRFNHTTSVRDCLTFTPVIRTMAGGRRGLQVAQNLKDFREI